jgi:hypothetical protein
LDVTWQEAVTFSLATLGAVLGILNTRQAMRRDQVRMRVRPLSVVALDSSSLNFGIEVVNLSAFALTVQEVGFTLDGRWAELGERAVVLQPRTSDLGPWPRRMESREAITLYFDARKVQNPRIGRAYVKTACGEYVYGTTPALKSLRNSSVG